MLINTNANSRIVRSANTSSLLRHIQKAARKSALGSICNQLANKSHRLHEVRVRFKPGTRTKLEKDLKGGYPWIT